MTRKRSRRRPSLAKKTTRATVQATRSIWKRSRKYWWARTALIGGTLLLALFLFNFALQLKRKPAELADFVGGGDLRTPEQTWAAYKDSFRAHATPMLRPEFLAALAQLESGGNPWATPRWKLRVRGPWDRTYAPSSSAVGLMQLTDGTFQRSRRFCVDDGRILLVGQWLDLDACWFNWSYTRLSGDDSIEMTSAYLTSDLRDVIGPRKLPRAQREALAGVIHLCGKTAGKRYLASKFRKPTRCGAHSVPQYLRKLGQLTKRLENLSR